LTCSDDQKNHIKVDNDISGKMELKAGSKQHQHIVGIDPDGSGTKIGMVALDLPGHLSVGDGDDSTKE
jgi:predicted RNase H-like nuclease (RuvC/YqgF family)